MRLGVSGKIFFAYTVLLVAFATNAAFTLIVIHRARQGIVANEAYLDLQGSVHAAEQVIQSSRRSPLGQTRGGTGPATTSRLVVRGALGGPRRSTPGLRPGRLDTTQMGPGAGSHA